MMRQSFVTQKSNDNENNEEARNLAREWQANLPNVTFVRDRYEADKQLEDCKSSIASLQMLRKGFDEEKTRGEKQLASTREKIKSVMRVLHSSKRKNWRRYQLYT